MRLTFGDMTREVNVFHLEKQPRDIENLRSEHGEELESEMEIDFELESDDFNLDQVVDSAVNWASNPISPTMEPTDLTSPSSEPASSLELKALPAHLKYAYLGEQETFPVIIASHLNDGEEKRFERYSKKT